MEKNKIPDNKIFCISAKECCKNAKRILDEAELLEFEKFPSTQYYLSMIAQEEVGKAFLLYLVSIEALPWTPFLLRATRDHQCKQLVGIILDYVSPDIDEFLRQSRKWLLDKKRLEFPLKVADAINILRHEKIRRWESNSWFWSEDPDYDETALGVFNGKVEKEKQQSLYVELGKNGQVCSTPEKDTLIKKAKGEYERGRRFESCIRRLLGDGNCFAPEIDRVQEHIREIFSERNLIIEVREVEN